MHSNLDGYEHILAIETSCDETAAAVVRRGRAVVGECVYSQIDIHREYGGVVPEIASRNHVLKLPYVVETALERANMDFKDMDAYAVTAGPGLVGALLTGVAYAKALAYANKKPLIAVNHIEGHICANYITHKELEPPFVCLVASGGHSHILLVKDDGYELLGRTRDDAAGECFDKVARILGLPYPGGPNLEKLALSGNEDAYTFPVSFKGEKHLDFSFSGVKTAAVNLLHNLNQAGKDYNKADIAASFQKSVVGVLIKNTFEAAGRQGINKIAISGGVSANAYLKAKAHEAADKNGAKLYIPEFKYCTDNAAMIGCAAYYTGKVAGLDLNATPALGGLF